MAEFKRLVVPSGKENLEIVSPRISAEKLRDSTYILHPGHGMGSCAGLLVGDEHQVIVDSMSKFAAKELCEAIDKISALPVKYLINTHGHEDHCGANKYFKRKGAEVVAHDNTRYEPGVHANVYFKDTYMIETAAETISLKHFIAHSFSDAVVHLENNNVCFMGDIYTIGSMPAISTSQGLMGVYKAIDYALSYDDGETLYVSGEGAYSSADGLSEFKTTWEELIARGVDLFEMGYSADEISNDAQMFEIASRFAPNISWNVRYHWLQWGLNFMLSERKIGASNKCKSFGENILELEGTFDFKVEKEIKVVRENENYFLCEEDRYILPLYPISVSELASPDGAIKLEFVTNDSGKVKQLVRKFDGLVSIGKKINSN